MTKKDKILQEIDEISAKLRENPVPAQLYKRGMLYLKIQEPDTGLLDFIAAIRADKNFTKKCKSACGKYHPLLHEKLMRAIFYELNDAIPRPVKRDKKD